MDTLSCDQISQLSEAIEARILMKWNSKRFTERQINALYLIRRETQCTLVPPKTLSDFIIKLYSITVEHLHCRRLLAWCQELLELAPPAPADLPQVHHLVDLQAQVSLKPVCRVSLVPGYTVSHQITKYPVSHRVPRYPVSHQAPPYTVSHQVPPPQRPGASSSIRPSSPVPKNCPAAHSQPC